MWFLINIAGISPVNSQHTFLKLYWAAVSDEDDVLFCCLVPECITDIRQTLCAPRMVGKQSTPNLAELVNVTSSSVIDQVKLVLTSLKVYFILYIFNPFKAMHFTQWIFMSLNMIFYLLLLFV